MLSILTTVGLKRMFARSSNTKFKPTKKMIRYAPMPIPLAVAPLDTVSIKNIADPIRKIPVLTIGHIIADANTARYMLIFSKSLYV